MTGSRCAPWHRQQFEWHARQRNQLDGLSRGQYEAGNGSIARALCERAERHRREAEWHRQRLAHCDDNEG